MPQRTLSEHEFNAIRDHVLAAAPNGLDETSFNRFIGPAMSQAIGEAESAPPAVDGSALSRFASNAWQMVNPVAIAQGLYGAVRHPVDTATNIGGQMLDQGRQAVDLARQGRYVEAAGHGVAAAVPIMGPAAAEAGDQIAAGDWAGGAGKAMGLLAPAGISTAARGVRAAARVLPARVGAAADAGAASRIVDVMAPKVGPNKSRFGNMAANVAPTVAKDLAKDGAALSREGLHQAMQGKLAEAETALDAAHDARFKAATFPTKPIIDALMEKRKALTSEAIKGSENPRTPVQRTSAIVDERGRPIEVTDLKREPIGSDVVPSPNNARVAVIDRAISELKQLGPVTRYDPIRTIRMAYDGPAKAIYSPAMTADYMKAQGGKLGAADVTGALRESLSTWDPKVAEANKGYSTYRSVNDVLEATAEVERTRPKVGRAIAAKVLGTLLGEHAAGPAGAVAGYAIAPAIESALSRGATTKLLTAKLLTQLAEATRSGNVARVDSLTTQLMRVGRTAAAVQGNATSPSGSRTQPVGASQ